MGKKKLTTEEFIKRSREIHGDKYNYDKVEYVNNKTKVIITCPVHGDFLQQPRHHLISVGCKKCIDQSRRTTQEEFIEHSNEIHNNKFSYDKVVYESTHTKVIITCPLHGDFSQTPAHHLQGAGCPCCARKNLSDNQRYSSKEFIEKARVVHGNMYDYSEVDYVNSQTKVQIICTVHGVYNQIPASHLQGNGCPHCTGRMGYTFESLSQKILDVHNGNVQLLAGQHIKGVEDKYLFKHICEHKWYAKASNILSGKSCPKCGGSQPYNYESLSEAINKKHNNEIKLLDGQIIKGVFKKYKFKHTCGNEWYATANDILRGRSCPACSKTGFNPEKPATFYILEISGNEYDFTGFGISNVFKNRKTRHKKNLKANNCSIVSEILIESDGLSIQNLENYVKQTLQCRNTHIEGFKTESLLIPPEELLDFCIKWLTANEVSYTLSVNT